MLIARLREVPIFKVLLDAELGQILRSPWTRDRVCLEGHNVVNEGEVADSMYLVLEGAVDVIVKNHRNMEIRVATLGPGDYFGEQALLPGSNGLRNATVRTRSRARLLRVAQREVQVGIDRNEDLCDEFAALRRAEQRRRNLLRTLRVFEHLSDGDFDKLYEWVETERRDSGDLILREGDTGDYFYVVEEGAVNVFVLDGAGKMHPLADIREAGFFGEQALLPGRNGIRNANVRATVAAKLLKLPKREFVRVLLRDPELHGLLEKVARARESLARRLASHGREGIVDPSALRAAFGTA